MIYVGTCSRCGGAAVNGGTCLKCEGPTPLGASSGGEHDMRKDMGASPSAKPALMNHAHEGGHGPTGFDPARGADYMAGEIVGHLGAARMQMLPSDDTIISEHIIAAHELAKALWRTLK